MVLDTRHFSAEFVDHLLASYDDLDETIDGLLVHSENWQALNLLSQKYDNKVQQIHIDPPYNTDVSGFLYKNDYRHSSWLSMMNDRLRAAKKTLHSASVLTCHIDEMNMNVSGFIGSNVWLRGHRYLG